MEIKNVHIYVKELLKEGSEYRDDHNRVLSRYYRDRLSGLPKMSVEEFLQHIYDGHFNAADSLSRACREIQEKNPELQGANYEKRKAREKQQEAERKYMEDQPTLFGEKVCDRKKTFMTPCYIEDGVYALGDDNKCIGCGRSKEELDKKTRK
jgi:hypothetical protein